MAAPSPLRHLAIEAKPTREGQKTRIFHADLLTVVAAPGLAWEFGSTSRDNTLRPVLLAYAATDQQARAFTANLRAGRPAIHDERGIGTLRIEIPRSAGFRYETFASDGGTLTFAYLPGAFSQQPAAAEQDAIRFLCMPPTWWVEREAATLSELGPDAREAALAARARTWCPCRRATPPPFATASTRVRGRLPDPASRRSRPGSSGCADGCCIWPTRIKSKSIMPPARTSWSAASGSMT